jgi:hypothetical protein
MSVSNKLKRLSNHVLLAALGLMPVGALASQDVVCSLPVGAEGVSYADEDIDEREAWGPSALEVGPDGTFWLADTAAGRVLHYSKDCQLLGIIQPKVVAVSALKVTGDSLFILDKAAMQPEVLHLGLSGAEHGRYPVSAEVTSLALGERGELLVELAFGASVEQLLDSNRLLSKAPQAGYVRNGTTYSVRPSDIAQDASAGKLSIGAKEVEVRVANHLGGLRVLDVAQDGSVTLKTEEVVTDGVVKVDATLRRYSPAGKLLGLARLPLAEEYTHVESNVAVARNGTSFVLVPLRDRVEIRSLSFSNALRPILPMANLRAQEAGPSRQDGTISPMACISYSTIKSNANVFLNNSKYMSSTNTDGSCSGRTKPRYLGGAGTYSSVSYDWGGFDSVSGFNSAMSPGTYQAGDTNSAGVESCSKGVDCSGFVSRTWGTTTKYGTSTLPNISWQLSSHLSMATGDIYNKSGSHVVLVDYVNNGVYVWESTTASSYDRVVRRYRDWSSFSGYVPRRYNNKC